VKIRVVAFARVREVLGTPESELVLAPDARISDAWGALLARAPALTELRASTRVARNGRIVADDCVLQEGDELALLPPSGGG
jgi:molybdopterin converting factor small subunit